MVSKKFWLGILVMVLVFGMTVVGCGNDDSTNGNVPQTVKYEGSDLSGNTYVLTVTEKADRAAYTPAGGDSYVLTIKKTGQPDKISRGTVNKTSADGTFTLQPSVEGSATFRIVISSEKISSVTGDIAVDGGETITARSFSTIYLRANRWDNRPDNEWYGEQWGSSRSILLSDFSNIRFNNNASYTIHINGIVDTKLDHLKIQFGGVLKDGRADWSFGNTSSIEFKSVEAGSFSYNITVNTIGANETSNISASDYVEFVVQLCNEMSLLSDENPTWGYNYGKIPENIPNGTIMATIRNFSISLIEE